jgi:hypothetical protein
MRQPRGNFTYSKQSVKSVSEEDDLVAVPHGKNLDV